MRADRAGKAGEVDAEPGFARHPDPGPFLSLVGPVHVRERDGTPPVFALRVRDEHVNAAGAAHGGLLMTLVDFALSRAIRAGAEGDPAPVTVSLTTDFLRPVEPGAWVEAHTRVERLGGTLAFADCSLVAGGREVVRARAVFAV